MQQGSDEWFQARLGRVTASRIADVMMKPNTAGYQNYLAQLICERLTGNPTESFTSAAMQHGTDTEPQARAFYELETGLDVQEVGFVPHPALQMSGASPDGLVGSDGGVEIKCPQPATHIKTLMGANIDRKYMLQMQWGMACTGRDWWEFISFCPAFPDEMKMYRRRVDRDAEMVEEITASVTQFLAEVEKVCATLADRQKDAT